MEGPDDDAEPTAVEGVDRRQLLLVGFCFLAVLIAALLVPPPVTPDVSVGPPNDDGEVSTPSQGGGGTGGGGGEGGGGGGSGDGDATGSGGDSGEAGGDAGGEGSSVVGDDGEPIPIPGGDAPPTADGCGVLLEDEPVPGSTTTVGVFRDREPVSGVRVRFNGDPVGRTDEHGRVTAPVPYNRTLSVTVDLTVDCEFYRERWESEDGSERAAFDSTRDRASTAPRRSDAGATTRGARLVALALDDAGRGRNQADRPENATGSYAVRGTVDVSVAGEPYPGSSLTVTASVADVPMEAATVSLDGVETGQTNASGAAQLTVPDGRQAVTVAVRRGDFGGEATVDVLLLTATVRPTEGFPFPGEPAVVNASLDGEPVGDVPVSVGGRRVGTTAADGSLGFTLPAVPGGGVVASTERQSAGRSLWSVYAPTLTNALLVCWLGVVAVGATRPWRAGGATPRVALAWSAFVTADAALVVGELAGLGLALLGMGLVGLVYYRRRVRSGGERAAGTAASAVAVVRRVALEIAVAIEGLLDRLRDLLARAWAVATSFETFAAWVGNAVRKVLATVWVYLTLRRAGVASLALVELAVANARWGDEGLVASVAALSMLAVFVAVWRSLRSDAAPTGQTEDDQRSTAETVGRRSPSDDDSADQVVSIRGLWRTFARWVVPGGWRTRTPGEVARAAVDRGFPEEPVEALTDAFRDVEYGSEPARTRRERAKAAFDRLRRTRREDDE